MSLSLRFVLFVSFTILTVTVMAIPYAQIP